LSHARLAGRAGNPQMIIGAACLLSGQLACLKGSLPAYKAACLLTRQGMYPR